MSRPHRGQLTAAHKARLAVEVIGVYVHVRRSLRGLTFPEAVQHIRRVTAEPTTPEADGVDALRVGLRLGRIVCRTITKLPADSRCLMRSLVLTRMLQRRGIPSTLHIGVRPGSEFAAHAWVEYRGTPLLPPGEGYGELLRI